MNVIGADRVSLDALCQLIAVQRHPADMPEAQYVGLEHVPSGQMRCAGVGKASDMQSHKFAFQANDVLYGKLRPYLDKAVLADSDGLCTTELLVLRAKRGVAPRFLACVVHAPDFIAHAMAGITGAHHPRTSWNHLAEFELPRYDLDAQRKIAALLWRVHDLIVACAASTGAAKALKQVSMRELFTRGLRGEPRKETEIGLVPEGWTPTPVVQLGEVKGGKRMLKGVSLASENTGQPYLRVTDFKDHSIRDTGILYVPKGYESVIERYRISSRDVYISIAGTIGLVGQVPGHFDDANLTENAAKIVVDREDVLPRYVMYALAGDSCQDQIGRATAKNAQPKLALTRIEQVLVPFPATLDEQSEIVAILGALDRKIDLHQRKRAVLGDLFKALLHKLMTGEIAVDELDVSALDRAALPEGASA